MAVVECVELTKVYGRQNRALHNLNLRIEQGMSFGLLGENGAGKSTLVKLVMGFIFPSTGIVRVLGEEQVARAHRRIGYAHERPIFETRFTGRRYLEYLGNLAGLWDNTVQRRIETTLAQVHLTDAADRAIGTYSKGMLQRLAIAQALLTDPEFLILDEPTSGLDPRSQWEVRQIISELRREGKTVLLCSHYMTEVEELCDTIGILRRGEMILSGKVADLISSGQEVVEITLAQNIEEVHFAERLGMGEAIIEARGNVLKVAKKAQAAILARLLEQGIEIVSLQPLSRTLEEVYVQTTRNADREATLTGSSTGGSRQ